MEQKKIEHITLSILLMVEGVASSFGSSATSSLSSEHDGLETSSVVSGVVSISGSDSEMTGSELCSAAILFS